MTHYKIWIDVEEWNDETDQTFLLDPPFDSVAIFDTEREAMTFAETLQAIGQRRAEPRAEPMHPATGEPTNSARAARVETFLAQYTAACYGAPEAASTIAQDMITDVLHWATKRAGEDDRIDVQDIASAAADMATAEIAAEA